MYKEHPVFCQPQNKNEKVWRYMDFTKFVSLLELESLYFTSADKFEDRFEGAYPKKNILEYQNSLDFLSEELKNAVIENNYKLKSSAPTWHFINCWHHNNYESVAMWKTYLKSNEGIAIQSTYQKLQDCFAKVDEDIFIGQVKYIDYETESFDTCNDNTFAAFVHKRKSFEHEREIRAVVINTENPWEKSNTYGLSIPANIDVLIEHIYVAPDAPPWFELLVESVVNRFGKNYPVMKSNLNENPLY